MAKDNQQYDLILIVDATASMTQYLHALNQSLPQIIAVSRLTGCFSHIGVLAYRDYDSPGPVVEWSGWQENDGSGKDIVSMARNLQPLGGYSWPEAVKTGLHAAWNVMRQDTETVVLLYADAPPHTSCTPSAEAHAECEELSRSAPAAQFCNWQSACHTLAGQGETRARFIPILDPIMSHRNSTDATLFTYLATVTNGLCVQLTNKHMHNISKTSMDVLLAWMGVSTMTSSDNKDGGAMISTFSDNAIMSRIDGEENASLSESVFQNPKVCMLDRLDLALHAKFMTPRPVPVIDPAKRYNIDGAFRGLVNNQLQELIVSDVSAISLNPVFGSLWRAVCNDRDNPSREALTSSFGTAVEKLPNADDKMRMKEWLANSYDYTAEVMQLIADVPEENQFPCVCFDPTQAFPPTESDTDVDTKHTSQEPSNIARDELLEISRSCNRRVLRRIGKCLSRLTYVECASDLPAHLAVAGIKDVPRIPLALARPAHKRKFWKILLHLIVPGTMLASRPAALLAALALRIGLRPLEDVAVEEVKLWKNRWTESLAYPETWSLDCLSLLLDADDVYAQKQRIQGQESSDLLIQADDHSKFDKLVSYKLLEMNLDTTLSALKGWTPEKTVLPCGPEVTCTRCEKPRSVTIMGNESVCGLCVADDSIVADDDQCPGGELPASATLSWVECSMLDCQAQYVVYRPKLLNVRPKCFYCRRNGTLPLAPNESFAAPSVQCQRCRNRVIYPEEYRPQEFNAAAFRCVACEQGRQTVIGVETSARKLRDENGTDWLLRNEGSLANSFGSGRTLFYTVSSLGLDNVAKLEVLPAETDAPDLALDGKPLHNVDALLDQLRGWVATRKVEQGTCSLCFEDASKRYLRSACGRRGCIQLVDSSCLASCYGANQPGRVLNTSALHCPFCRRSPTAKTLARYGHGVHAVVNLQSAIDDPGNWIYAWCSDCDMAKQYAERVCAAGAPELSAWRCDDCETKRQGRAMDKIKGCPGCQQPTEKTGGCNHIQCTICDTHWCFVCGEASDAEKIYPHMYKAHGGYQEEEDDDGNWEGDEEDVDMDYNDQGV